MLKDMGFSEDQIHEEYVLRIEGNGDRQHINKFQYRIDVAGISSEKKVAIECGRTSGNKIMWLKPFFDEVVLLPHIKVFGSKNQELEYRLRKIQQKLKDKEKDYKQQIANLSEKNNQMLDHIQTIERKLIVFLVENKILPEHFLSYNTIEQIPKWGAEFNWKR